MGAIRPGKCFSACQNGGPDACLSEENECLVYMLRSPVAGAPEEHNTQVQEAGGPAPRPAGAAAAPATPTPLLPPPSRSLRAPQPQESPRHAPRVPPPSRALAPAPPPPPRVRSSSFSELDTQGLKFCRSSRQSKENLLYNDRPLIFYKAYDGSSKVHNDSIKKSLEFLGTELLIPEEVSTELKWWLQNLHIPYLIHEPQRVMNYLTTDASDQAWVAQINDSKRDNRTVMAYIKQEGGTRSLTLHCLAKTLLDLIDELDSMLTPQYLPGVTMQTACHADQLQSDTYSAQQ
ncbi:unnamed protein product [Plutella xylostella]|uniref:(diamondback moth) hypothetical protein n=1 Tax=Plutella xylostella TaxID=51655 RepID=A0A8S4DVT7_PLUXY|nr:unnamed protein product [Plutella xylostella]